jgi:hypothetical protein
VRLPSFNSTEGFAFHAGERIRQTVPMTTSHSLPQAIVRINLTRCRRTATSSEHEIIHDSNERLGDVELDYENGLLSKLSFTGPVLVAHSAAWGSSKRSFTGFGNTEFEMSVIHHSAFQ